MLVVLGTALFVAIGSYIIFRGPNTCDTYRKLSFPWLRYKINTQVYGQDIAKNAVLDRLERYFITHESSPLFLSFHGGIGVGKNYMAQIISDYFPDKKTILFTAESDFPHAHLGYEYRLDVERRIRSAISECHVNIIIFDEVDRISEVVFYRLHIALKNLNSKMPVIIILLSNSKAQAINNVVFTTDARETLERENFEFSRSDEEWYAGETWREWDILFVPFLPLEKSHVIKCIESDMLSKGKKPTKEIISNVLEELTFLSLNGNDYSVFGCKRVSEKVDLVTL